MNKTWLYLSAEGLDALSAESPASFWRGTETVQNATLADIARRLAGHAVEWMLPMEVCSWLLSDPWPGRARPSAQALAYSIEERLAEDLDTLHLCTGSPDTQRRFPVLVIERARFASLLRQMNELGLNIAAVHVDALLLPVDRACAAWWQGRWIVGGAVEARLALTSHALKEMRGLLPGDLEWLEECQEGEAPETIRHLLCGNTGQSVNLLQGEFRQVRRHWPWRMMVFTVLGVFALTWGFTQARSQFLEHETQRLYAQSVERFKALYPQQTRIVDLSAQLRAMQRTRPGTEVTQMARLANLTEQVLGGSSVEMQQIEFRAGEGWTIQLTARSFAELEQLRERGQQSALPIKLGSASKDRKGVQAVLTLSEVNG